MFGKLNKSGFSLIEIMLVIGLVGIMLATAIPRFQGRKPSKERAYFVQQLNGLTRYGWQSAVMTHKLHRVYFDFQHKQIRLEVEAQAKDGKGEAVFVPVSSTYVNHVVVIPDHLQVKNFMIEGKEDTSRFSKLNEVWFYIVPEGLTQEVTINMADIKDVDMQNRPRHIRLVLNPFSAQFKVYDAFQK